MNMSNTRSCTKKYFLLLSISIISTLLFLLPLVSFGQQNLSFNDVVVTTNPAGYVLVQATITNTSDAVIENAYYGVSMSPGDETTQVFSGLEQGETQLNLEPGLESTVSVTFKPPKWIDGTQTLQFVVVDEYGFQLGEIEAGSISPEGTPLEIDVLEDTCVFLREEMTSVTCDVANNSDETIGLTKEVVVYTPHLFGFKTNEVSLDGLQFPPQETLSVEFVIPVDHTNSFSAKLSLLGDTSRYHQAFVVYNEEYISEVGTDIPHTVTEKRFLIYTLASVIALSVLLAILVYRRKTTEQLEVMSNPEK